MFTTGYIIQAAINAGNKLLSFVNRGERRASAARNEWASQLENDKMTSKKPSVSWRLSSACAGLFMCRFVLLFNATYCPIMRIKISSQNISSCIACSCMWKFSSQTIQLTLSFFIVTGSKPYFWPMKLRKQAREVLRLVLRLSQPFLEVHVPATFSSVSVLRCSTNQSPYHSNLNTGYFHSVS